MLFGHKSTNPFALERLSEKDWYSKRAQENEPVYFRVQPGSEWLPADRTILEEEKRFFAKMSVSLDMERHLHDLDTDALTIEQINLLLTNLPVNVTFVDENDEVRFFSPK